MGVMNFTESQKDAIWAKDCSIAVSAAAGSGKTAVLTRRIIERVTASDGTGDLSRILVVTFTKAAAAELVSRISDALEDALAKEPDNRHIRAQALLVPSAHISTIHSFCLDLIRTNFQKLQIPADFSAANETEISLMMREIAEELTEECFEGEAGIPFRDFNLLADTVGETTNGDKLISVMLDLYKYFSSTEAFLDSIDKTASDMRDAAANGFDGSTWERAIRGYLFDLLRHYKKIYADAVVYIADHEELMKYDEAFSDDLRFIDDVLSHADEGYDEMVARLIAFQPKRLATVKNADAFELVCFYKEARTKFKDDLKKLREECYMYSPEVLQNALIATADVLSDLSLLLHAFEERFAAEKERRRIITFTDMERYAYRLLFDSEKGEATPLAIALRESYDEIFIDEYQDTNELQDKIFRLISKEDNRFNVGDKKQSIYSFRGAEPSLFDGDLQSRPKYDREKKVSAVKIFLSENFRSTFEVLDFCNGVFDTLMNTSTVSYGKDERLNCGSGKRGPLPKICLVSKEGDGDFEEDTDGEWNEEGKGEKEPSPDMEAAFVADKIAEYLSGPPKADGTLPRPSDVAILLRSTSTSALIYENALKRRGIPCRNTAAIEFFESPEVLLMLSLLNVIDNPSRDIYLAAALKSPIFGVTLDELLYMKRKYPNGYLYDALRHFTEETSFQKGKSFLALRDRFATLAAETSCDRLIWQLYSETGIFSLLCADRERAVYEIEEAKANLVMLYHYAKSFEQGGFKGLSGFLSFVGKVLANKEKMDISQFAAPGEVVDIMTIHRSKGLEFPVVFVCGLSRQFNFPEEREKTVYYDPFGVAVKLSSLDGVLRMDTPMRRAILFERRSRAVEEELRVFYVALTRAKEKLYLTATVKKDDLDSGKYDFSEASEYALRKRYFSSYTVRRARNYLELLLTAAVGMEGRFEAEYVTGGVAPAPSLATTETKLDAEDMTFTEAMHLVHERLDFQYPYERLCRVPSKLSVSKLYPEVLDESSEGVAEKVNVPEQQVMPRFLMREEADHVTAAERGTAMHTFMQFCDFQNVMDNGIEAEIERLAALKFIFPADAGKMDRGRLSRFFESRLAREMMTAKALYRERRFMLRFPASLFTKEKSEVLEKEEILVQGVIDCAYRNEAGELILVDYKTDHFSPFTPRETMEATLRERHTEQLSYYKLACEKLFGALPDHTYLYSFALGDVVEIY